MAQHHPIRMSKQRFKDGLRIFECDHCDYAFAAKVDDDGIVQLETRVPINHGELTVAHSFMQVYDQMPELNMGGMIKDQAESPT